MKVYVVIYDAINGESIESVYSEKCNAEYDCKVLNNKIGSDLNHG